MKKSVLITALFLSNLSFAAEYFLNCTASQVVEKGGKTERLYITDTSKKMKTPENGASEETSLELELKHNNMKMFLKAEASLDFDDNFNIASVKMDFKIPKKNIHVDDRDGVMSLLHEIESGTVAQSSTMVHLSLKKQNFIDVGCRILKEM